MGNPYLMMLKAQPIFFPLKGFIINNSHDDVKKPIKILLPLFTSLFLSFCLKINPRDTPALPNPDYLNGSPSLWIGAKS